MGMAGYDMVTPDIVNVGSGVNWVLIGVIIGCFVFGVVIGIILGRRAMKKRDI